MAKRIAVLVSNDLNHDQRVLKTCATLEAEGWSPVLTGREMPGSKPLDVPFEAKRLKLPFHRGVGFYATLQFGMLRALSRADIGAVWANDLDTLLPAYLIARAKGLPLVYDSHEYFTEAAGLTGSPLKRQVCLALERWCMKRIPCMITVNELIAEAYASRYGIRVEVVRNMPRLLPMLDVKGREAFEAYGVPTDLPIALMQGAYMDRDRGAAEAVAALEAMKGVRLVLVGAGIEWEEARAQVNDPKWNGRLHCIPKLPFDELRVLTASADVGLSLDKGGHGNYEMSLPNKLFDFMHAGLPMVTTARKQVAAVVEEFGLGVVVNDLSPATLADAVREVLSTPRESWKMRAMNARELHHWDVDAPKLLNTLEHCLNAHLAGSHKG